MRIAVIANYHTIACATFYTPGIVKYILIRSLNKLGWWIAFAST